MTPAAFGDTQIEAFCKVAHTIGDKYGTPYALALSDAMIRSGTVIIRDVKGTASAMEALYRAADALPLPDAGSMPVSSFKAVHRQALWISAVAMLDRAAYVLAGLGIGVWFTLAHLAR